MTISLSPPLVTKLGSVTHPSPKLVILDSHFHAILAAPDLSRTLADLKRTTAQRLLDPLEAENCEWLLHQFEFPSLRSTAP